MGFWKLWASNNIAKKAIRNVNKSPYNCHSLPIFKLHKTLIFNDIFSLQCLKFQYKYVHHSLPEYFINAEFLKHYQINTVKYSLRKSSSITIPDYFIEAVNYRPHYAVPQTKKQSCTKRLSYFLPNKLNINPYPHCISDKLQTHSLSGLSVYYKNFMISNYQIVCNIPHCIVCQDTL